MYLTLLRAFEVVGTSLNKRMESLVKICTISLIINILAYPCTNAWIIRNIRSTEGLQEPENTREAVSGDSSGIQSAVMPSQINRFQYLLPFWWHYLRPMLNVFATNTNFRQTLQKEYEYEIEHGSADEIESPTPEADNWSSIGQTEAIETDEGETSFELKPSEPTDDGQLGSLFMNQENIKESNGFTPFGTEAETNEPTNSGFSELESTPDNLHSEQDTRNDDPLGSFGNSEMILNNFNSESENSGEQSEEEQRRFALTGNIVGSFSNSLMEIMPSLQEPSEHESHSNVKAYDEVDANTPVGWEQNEGGTLEMKESNPSFGGFNFATTWSTNTVQNSIGGQFRQDEDIGDQGGQSIGFLGGQFTNESQQDEPSDLFTGVTTPFTPVDSDNSDNVGESFSGQTFTPQFFSPNLHPQNDQDSSS